MMVMMMTTAADGLCQILDIGELPALRGVAEIRRQLGELAGGGGVARRRSGLGGALQVGRDLLRHLLILGGVRLLQLLKRAHQLREGRKLAVVRRWLERGRTRAVGLAGVG